MGSVGGSEAAVISLGVYSDVDGGHLALLDGKTGALIKENKEVPLVMASVAVNESSDAFVSMNGQDFELYRRDSLCHTSLLCTLPCDPPLVRYPKQVAFVEGSKLVVGGTDRGKANVYDAASKQLVGTLDYPLGGLVQPVATCSTEELSYIAIAGSTLQQPSSVLIWVKRHSPITRPLTSTQGGIDPLQTGSIHVSSARSTFSDVEHVLRNIFLLVFYATAIFITVTIAWLFAVRTFNEIKDRALTAPSPTVALAQAGLYTYSFVGVSNHFLRVCEKALWRLSDRTIPRNAYPQGMSSACFFEEALGAYQFRLRCGATFRGVLLWEVRETAISSVSFLYDNFLEPTPTLWGGSGRSRVRAEPADVVVRIKQIVRTIRQAGICETLKTSPGALSFF
ncbi:hypothetical protein BDZ89DRAFT_1051887 [Hymenopellis radicata]|nr:hypothetical protein BDZ89DRAFT_1051887 [Hymenopellis radicata]